jgi:hypothetical protein
MTEWKEYTTLIIAAVTLVVAIAAFIAARRTLRVTKRAHEYAKESDRQSLRNLIASKEAQAEAIDGALRRGMYDNGMVRTMMTQKAMLDAEIKQLKEQLGK